MAFIDYQKISPFTGERYICKSISDDEDQMLVPSSEWLEYQRVRTLEIELQKSGIPLHVIDYDIPTDYIGNKSLEQVNKCVKYVQHFEDKFYNKCLYFYGDSGTQKTTVAQWIAKKLIETKKTVKYVTMNSLVKDLTQEQFSDEAKERLDCIRNTDLIIMDRAFDKSQVTLYNSGYQLSFLDSFLRDRIEIQQKAIIIISNNPISDISKHKFNADIQDLIHRFVLPIEGSLLFEDHYSQKELFDAKDLWK